MYILPTKKLTSATDAAKAVRGRQHSDQPAIPTMDEHEALEMIQRICLVTLRANSASAAVVKSPIQKFLTELIVLRFCV